jgi:nicotinamidase-related amidase
VDRLSAASTALLLIDLQKGILQIPVVPHVSADIVARAARLTDSFRKAGATIIRTRVAWSSDFRDALQPAVDRPLQAPAPGPDWAEFPLALHGAAGDLEITKRQWGAFYGTELDLQLRRRGIRTLVLAGIATNLGVESTARAAWEHGYELVLVEDVMASLSADMHGFAVNVILPLIGRVRTAKQVSAMLAPDNG